MSGLSLPKVSGLMTPLERAKLIISLELKGFGEVDLNGDGQLPSENEIKQIATACPASQAREYNFLIRLKDSVWKRFWVLIELYQNYLENLDGRMTLVRFLLNISPAVSDCIQIVRGLPLTMEADNKERDVAIGYLESLLPVGMVDEEDKAKVTVVKLTNPLFAERLKSFKLRFAGIVDDIHRYIAVVERIEQKHFGGMEIVSRDLKHPTGVIPRAVTEIGDVVESHNDYLRKVTEGFNLMGMGLKEYSFGQLDEFLLKVEPKVDGERVEKELAEVEEEARR